MAPPPTAPAAPALPTPPALPTVLCRAVLCAMRCAVPCCAAAMDKKAKSKQMKNIVDRLQRYGEFEVGRAALRCAMLCWVMLRCAALHHAVSLCALACPPSALLHTLCPATRLRPCGALRCANRTWHAVQTVSHVVSSRVSPLMRPHVPLPLHLSPCTPCAPCAPCRLWSLGTTPS